MWLLQNIIYKELLLFMDGKFCVSTGIEVSNEGLWEDGYLLSQMLIIEFMIYCVKEDVKIGSGICQKIL